MAEAHATDRGEHAGHQLFGGHLHGEDRHGLLDTALQRRELGHVDGEGRLAHRWAAGDDHEIARTQTAGLAVELVETGGQTAQATRVVVPFVDLVDERRHQRLHGHRAVARTAHALLRDGEHPPLGVLDELARGLAFVVEDRSGDIGAGLEQLPQQGALAHDAGIGADIGRCRGVADQRTEIGQAARISQAPDALEMLADRDGIGGFARPRDLPDGLEDQTVVGTVEVLGSQHIGHVVPGLGVEEQAA